MKITGNTVLISGGTAGIGLELAKLFIQNNNTVIITGRNQERLDNALAELPGAIGIVVDVSKKDEIAAFAAQLKAQYPNLNVVINNAGRAVVYNLLSRENVADIALDEMTTNYLAVIHLNELLLPLLSQQKESAIVNVSSVVAIVPGSLATYSASKAALHSYTQSLRYALENEHPNVKIFELMPPLVNTEFSAEIGGANGIPASQVAAEFWKAFEKDENEIHVGVTQQVYEAFLKDPKEAFKLLNHSRK